MHGGEFITKLKLGSHGLEQTGLVGSFKKFWAQVLDSEWS